MERERAGEVSGNSVSGNSAVGKEVELLVIIEPRTVKLTTRTGVEVRRSVPHAKLRRIGAWVFVDHFGPTPQTAGMVVQAHPHTGLQTVTWLIEGSIDHRDSIGSVQTIIPGQLNLMTAGRGISHSELSLSGPKSLHAVQLWIALPDEFRSQEPFFEHQANLPKLQGEGFSASVLVGEFLGEVASTKVFSELVGVELRVPAGSRVRIPLNSEFEYGLLLASGDALVSVGLQKDQLQENQLGFWSAGETEMILESKQDLVALLLGGKPFAEPFVMWWNFIERSHQEIVEARRQWNARDARFGEFTDDIGGYIPAPELPNVTLTPR